MEDHLSEEFSRAHRAGETVVVNSTADDPRTDGPAHARLKIGAFVSIPFHRDGRWTVHLAATNVERRDWCKDEIDLLLEVSARLFARIERVHVEAALRQSEQKYRTLFETMSQGYADCELIRDADGRAADTAKDHFLAVLSHELRTPLMPITMALAALERRQDMSGRSAQRSK